MDITGTIHCTNNGKQNSQSKIASEVLEGSSESNIEGYCGLLRLFRHFIGKFETTFYSLRVTAP
jgi:hypothetical protein